MPVSARAEGRPRRAGRDGAFMAREVVLSSDEHGDPPAPPHYLDPREVEVFLELWQEPVARLWEPGDAALVALLARMVVSLEGGATESWISARIMSLRSALFLSPRTRRSAGIRIERVDEPGPEGGTMAPVVPLETPTGDAVDRELAAIDRELEAALARERV
jgi:hypothetical protein